MTNKTFTLTFSLLIATVIAGCTRNAETDLALRKFLVGHDGLSCSESYSEMLKEGETQQYAQENYDRCINGA